MGEQTFAMVGIRFDGVVLPDSLDRSACNASGFGGLIVVSSK